LRVLAELFRGNRWRRVGGRFDVSRAARAGPRGTGRSCRAARRLARASGMGLRGWSATSDLACSLTHRRISPSRDLWAVMISRSNGHFDLRIPPKEMPTFYVSLKIGTEPPVAVGRRTMTDLLAAL
jgi:hypothetical protein